MEFIRDFGKMWRGVLFALAIAVPAWLLGKQFEVIGGPVFAILIGMVLALVVPAAAGESLQAGVKFTSKKVLQWAVILLGFGLNLAQIARVGLTSLPIIVSTIVTSLVVSFVLCRALNIPGKISTLIGVGSSICGGSAIAATAPVIDADDEEIAQAISVIFLFNVIAALVFPAFGGALGLTNEGFGLFAGTAVNDTSSVTAAAAAWDGMHPGANTLDSATIVKLTRTLAIIPITLALALWQVRQAKRGAAGEGVAEVANGGASTGTFDLKHIFPFFVIFFVLASVVTTVFALPAAVTAPVKELSKFLIIMAMAAIGFNTNIMKLVRTGGKPILMGLACWVAIALVSLGMQHLLGIW
ncbi:YeiH family protein [Enorma sp.]|uniref:YeiH family protein n=1 Tax=Enorma sp. TaxID=1920692 RepID=UPI0028051560|nr:YeiH family protein [uncultured Enorma sp.]